MEGGESHLCMNPCVLYNFFYFKDLIRAQKSEKALDLFKKLQEKGECSTIQSYHMIVT